MPDWIPPPKDLAFIATMLFSVGVFYSGHQEDHSRLEKLENRIESIDRDGTRGLAALRTQGDELVKANERRISANEAQLASIVPLVSRIDANIAILMDERKHIK